MVKYNFVKGQTTINLESGRYVSASQKVEYHDFHHIITCKHVNV